MKYIFITLIAALSFNCFGQEKIEVQPAGSIHLAPKQQFIGTDLYNDIYFTEGNAVKKKNKYNTSSYSKSDLVNLTHIDIQNPAQTILFYKDNKTFVVTSKELSQLSIVDIQSKFPSMDLVYVGSSTKKDVWMMNEANNTVARYNTTTLERHTVHTITTGKAKHYASTIHYFFWIDENNLLKGIDVLGKEVVTYQLESNFDAIQIIDDQKMFYRLGEKLYYVDMVKAKRYEIVLEEKSIETFFYNSQKMSIFADQKINNYLIKLP